MANDNIKSLNEADKRIAELQAQIASAQTQIKELQTRSSNFVDNPNNSLNKEVVLSRGSVLYIPTNDSKRHYSMKLEDIAKHFHQYHYPIYFHNEVECSIFDSLSTLLFDLIKFKNKYDSSTDMNPTKANPVYLVYLDTDVNKFVYTKTSNMAIPTIYFGSMEVAENCCTWLNYRYGLGDYKKTF